MSAPQRKRPGSRLAPKVESIVGSVEGTEQPPAQPEPRPSAVEHEEPAAHQEPAPQPKPSAARKPSKKAKRAPAPTPDEGTKGPGDVIRPSNVHIPVGLMEPLEAKCRERGLTHGELIIVALEEVHPRLSDVLDAAATAGGSLFAPRRGGRASRSADGPLTPLNYRMRVDDFSVLDQLVEQFGASSRGHLITAALKAYLNP